MENNRNQQCCPEDEIIFGYHVDDIADILKHYDIFSTPSRIVELQRYDYNDHEVRVILKVLFDDHFPVVIKLKNEKDLSIEIFEKQCVFSELLASHGIFTAKILKNGNHFVTAYHINRYNVLVTVEQFVDHELTVVDENIAYKTGMLLASTHTIAEKYDVHVPYPVLFDPFTKNDLFFVEEFQNACNQLTGDGLALYDKIMDIYEQRMSFLEQLKHENRYAVQGDISCCNLFAAKNGEIGMFDFNRCGDNNLFCDAIMQAVFEARLMDYPKDRKIPECDLFYSFLQGYHQVRPFSKQQLLYIPNLYAIISAFWGMDILYDADDTHLALTKLVESQDTSAIMSKLNDIYQHISYDVAESLGVDIASISK